MAAGVALQLPAILGRVPGLQAFQVDELLPPAARAGARHQLPLRVHADPALPLP